MLLLFLFVFLLRKQALGQAWWHTPLFPVLGRQKQTALYKFKANLVQGSQDYIVRLRKEKREKRKGKGKEERKEKRNGIEKWLRG